VACARVDEEGMVYQIVGPMNQSGSGGASSSSISSSSSSGGSTEQEEAAKTGTCVYFCDRFRRYRFRCGDGGLALLSGLVAANARLLSSNDALFATLPAKEVARLRQQG
jgi:hypothetical protein